MSFSYYTVYRTEGLDFDNRTLTGAAFYPDAAAGEDTWIFWAGWNDYKSAVKLYTFLERRSDKDGVIHCKLAPGGKEVRFIPVKIEHIKENPGFYDLKTEDTLSASQGDVHLVYHAAELSEDYEAWVAPPEAHITAEDAQRLGRTTEELIVEMMADRLDEIRGRPSPVGLIVWWQDGHGHEYPFKKMKDGDSFRWVRVKSDWRDEHPDLPRSSADAWLRPDPNDPNSGLDWDPTRRMLHEKLVNQFFEGKTPVAEGSKPTAIFVMGMPASGKSTLVEHPEKVSKHLRRLQDIVHLDPDLIVEGIPEFQKAKELKVRTGSSIVYEEAQYLNDQAIKRAINGRYNFAISGTGGNLGWIQDNILPLSKKGWEVIIYMPHVNDLDDLMVRSEARGERSGRFVPANVLANLWEKIPQNFMTLKNDPRVSEVALINTGHKRPNATPAYTYRRDPNGGPPDENVLDPAFWEEFQKNLHESVEDALARLDADQASRLQGFMEAIRLDLLHIESAPRVYKPGEGMVDRLPDYVGSSLKIKSAS